MHSLCPTDTTNNQTKEHTHTHTLPYLTFPCLYAGADAGPAAGVASRRRRRRRSPGAIGPGLPTS